MTSKFEWVSAEAVEEHRVKSPFFLPLAFEPAHFERAKEHIWAFFDTINNAILSVYQSGNGRFSKPTGFRWMDWANEKLEMREVAGAQDELSPRLGRNLSVLFWMIEDIVQSLFEACDRDFEHAVERTEVLNKFALRNASQAETAIISYGLLFHLALCLYRSEPDLLRQAADNVRTALKDDSSSKHKGFLDEFLIITMVVSILPSLDTCDHVNPSFIIDTHLGVTISDTNTTLVPTRSGNAANIRKAKFHVLFSHTFDQFYSGETGLSKLDGDFGILKDEAIDVMVQGVREICRG